MNQFFFLASMLCIKFQMADGGKNTNAEEAIVLQPNAFNGLVIENNVQIINEANNIALNDTMGPLNAMVSKKSKTENKDILLFCF